VKKSIVLFAVSLFVAGVAAAADVRGAWTADAEDNGRIQMNLSTRGGHSRHGETMAVSDFSGLSDGVMRGSAQTPVNFELRREAGNVAFEGTFKNGFGAGQFTFTPNPNYVSQLRNLGVTFEDNDRDDEQYLTMALLDVSTAYIRSMQAEGYRESGDKYLAFRIFKVTPELVRELRSLGYDKIDADDLVAMRIHGDSPQFIRELKDAGYEHVPVEKLIEMRIHGIDANFVRKMNKSS